MNIIPYYAYPRSGATLLSTILNNHPDFIVTPEMFDTYTTKGLQNKWPQFIDYFNKTFSVNFYKDAKITQLDNYLSLNHKFLFFRVHLSGVFKENPSFAKDKLPTFKQLFLIRNFYHSIGSQGIFKKNDSTKSTLDDKINMFEQMLQMINQDNDIIVYYEELLKNPKNVYFNLLKSLNKSNTYDDSYLNVKTFAQQFTSGDFKIAYTKNIHTGTKYYKYQFSKDVIKTIRNRLNNYSVLKYLKLQNPDFLKTFLGSIDFHSRRYLKDFLIKMKLFNFFYFFYKKLTPNKIRSNYETK